MRKVGPFMKWFGSKWQSAKHYPAPVYSTIVEPYAGGAGYACNYADRSIVLYEADRLLIDLWRWLIEQATPANIAEIPLPITGLDIRELGLSSGQSLLVRHWSNTNPQTCSWVGSSWANKPGFWTANTRSRLADQIGAIKHWRLGGPVPVEPATWYIDPPYQHNRYRYKTKGFDYSLLGAFVRTLPAGNQVIVCEARSKTGDLPDWLPFVDSHRSVTSRRKETQSHHSNEVVYLQGPQA